MPVTGRVDNGDAHETSLRAGIRNLNSAAAMSSTSNTTLFQRKNAMPVLSNDRAPVPPSTRSVSCAQVAGTRLKLGLRMFLADRCDSVANMLLRTAGDNHGRALAGQARANDETNAGGCAGDQRNFACQL